MNFGGGIMARQARIQSPTNYYHIMARGNNREYIFNNPIYKSYYLEVLKEQVEDGLIEIAAYCIMDNHVHIVVEADMLNLIKAMKSINIKFAMKINHQKNRVGHVFQDRYRSEAIYNDSHLQQIIRYVHNNPIKAKICKALDVYKWSSYNEYINVSEIINENQKEFIFNYYNNDIKNFVKFHKEVDYNEYLEIKEDIETQRLDHAQNIIQDYFIEHGISETKQISKNPHHLEMIIKNLLDKSKLSHRKIADLLEINRGDVNRVKVED